MPKNRKMWVVVHVASGIPVEVKAYPNPRAAARREKRWRQKSNPENDAIGVFRVRIK